MRMRGKGDFAGTVRSLWHMGRKYIPRGIGALGASALGQSPSAGWNLGGQFSRHVLGWGDFGVGVPWKVVSNSLMSSGAAPVMGNGDDGAVRMKHKEFVGAILSSTAFENRTYAINPGLDALFPWAANVANNFQKYRLEGLMVLFESSIPSGLAEFSSMGSIIVAANLNPSAPTCQNQLELEQMQFASSAKPSESIAAPIECAPRMGATEGLSVRNGAVPYGASINDYDHATLQIATVGQPVAGVQLGRLYVVYDMVLLLPKYNGAGGATSDALYAGTSASATYPFGTVRTQSFDNVGVEITADTIHFPAGSAGVWTVTCAYQGSAASVSVPTITYHECKEGPTLFSGGSASAQLVPASGSQTQAIVRFTLLVDENASTPSVVLSSGVLPTSATVDVFIQQVNPRV